MQKNLILKGMGASTGVTKGKVKIIKSGEQYPDFIPGEILVTKITDPSMVMFMSKAAAIITDIGGINSHPAIVSRELGIPCIVATETATLNLRDGQEIIVDGLKGEIYSANGGANNDQDYDDLLEAYRQAWAKMDINIFKETVDFKKLDPLIAESWMKKVIEIIEEAEKQNLSYREIAELFHSPNTLRNNGIFDLFMASHAKLSGEKRKKVANFYINNLKAICLKDPFSLDGHNVIHGQAQIEEITNKVLPASMEIAKKLGRVINACYHMGYSLFDDMNPQLVYENYGPYYIEKENEKKYLVVIKEFKNMKPVELWPETSRLPFSKIKIISLYENVKFSIDAITHTSYKGNIIDGLKYYAIYLDDRLIDINEIDNISTILEKYADFIWFVFKNMSDQKFRILYLYQKAYNYINLCKKLGLEWRPSKKIIDDILNQPYKKWPEFKTPSEENEFFLKIMDPRTNFYG